MLASAHGGHGRWGQAITWMGMPDDEFASSGHRPVARRLYEMAGVGPDAVDVALLYDHFTPMVIMQLEDYGFCGIGEGGPFVADGNIRWPDGGLPVNTHGGNLSEAYIIGMTHVKEAVEQLRGTAVNQVDGRRGRARHRWPGVDPRVVAPLAQLAEREEPTMSMSGVLPADLIQLTPNPWTEPFWRRHRRSTGSCCRAAPLRARTASRRRRSAGAAARRTSSGSTRRAPARSTRSPSSATR